MSSSTATRIVVVCNIREEEEIKGGELKWKKMAISANFWLLSQSPTKLEGIMCVDSLFIGHEKTVKNCWKKGSLIKLGSVIFVAL